MFNIDYDTEIYLRQGLTLEEADAMGVLGGHDYYLNVERTINAKEDSWKFSVKDFQDEDGFIIEPTNDITKIIDFATDLLYGLACDVEKSVNGDECYQDDNCDEEYLADTKYCLNILEEAKQRIIKRRERK